MKASQKPNISVVMSVYNGMPYLKEAVQSVLSQTYKNFEFIIVDDASIDDSWKYLKSLSDKRIKIIKNEKNLGLASSLNIGLKAAKGDYIARMDADDISHPQRFEKQIKFLSDNKGIDLCGTWVTRIDEKGKVIGQWKTPISDKEIKNFMRWATPIAHPTFMAKRSFYDSNLYDPQFDYAEEYELLMRSRAKSKFANIPQKLLSWRSWDERRSRTSWDKMEKVDLKIKEEAFKKGYFGAFYIFVIAAKFFTTYLLPYQLKLTIFKYFKML